MFQKLVHTRHDNGLFVLRLVLGLVMLAHGSQKMFGWFGGYGFGATLHAFTGSYHIPAALAVLAIIAEFFGAIGLVLGFLGRVAAFGIACVMVGAVLTAGHLSHGFFMNWGGTQGGEGFEYHLLVVGMALAIMIDGSGAFSFDHTLSQSGGGASAETPRLRHA